MQIQDIMTFPVTSVKPDDSVSTVATLLHEKHLTGMPVLNYDGRVVGLITEREFFTKDFSLHLPTYAELLKKTDFVLGGKKTLPYAAGQVLRIKAKDIMNKKVVFLSPEESVEKASELFASTGQNPIPVTDSQSRLIGILSRSDFIKLFANAKRVQAVPQMSDRPVDRQLKYVKGDISARFTMIAKTRVNIWVTVATILLVLGFIAGIIFAADPNILLRGR